MGISFKSIEIEINKIFAFFEGINQKSILLWNRLKVDNCIRPCTGLKGKLIRFLYTSYFDCHFLIKREPWISICHPAECICSHK